MKKKNVLSQSVVRTRVIGTIRMTFKPIRLLGTRLVCCRFLLIQVRRTVKFLFVNCQLSFVSCHLSFVLDLHPKAVGSVRRRSVGKSRRNRRWGTVNHSLFSTQAPHCHHLVYYLCKLASCACFGKKKSNFPLPLFPVHCGTNYYPLPCCVRD